jgi:hypothetical protein
MLVAMGSEVYKHTVVALEGFFFACHKRVQNVGGLLCPCLAAASFRLVSLRCVQLGETKSW